MPVRYPVVGGDPNTWGTILNNYLNGVLPYVVTDSQWGGGADSTGVTTSNTAIQAALNQCQSGGGGVVVIPDPGSYLLSAPPLRIPSNTWLQAGDATITLAAGSLCNAVQSWAVQANRRVTDGVTNSTTTFTSATAAFTSGDVGSKIRIYYADGTWLDTTIASFTSSTTVVLAAAAAVSQTGLYAVFGAGRDSNIRMTGGLWVRQNPNGSDFNSHDMRFRHCDGLEISEAGGTIAAGSSKFFISVADCSVFSVHDITPTSTSSDTVHVTGPASAGFIARISNPAPGDDVVAFTCNDFAGYNDTAGNITDITVDGVRVPAAGGNGTTVKVLAGVSSTSSPYLLDRITVRDVRSKTDNYAVNICTDTGSPNTQGGTWGTIVVDGAANINPASTFPAVNVIAATVADLTVRAASNVNPSNTNVLSVQANATVTRLLTDADTGRVALVAGSNVGAYINETVTAPTPLYQAAVMYGDGTSVSASVADTAVLDITGAMSVEMWLNPSPSQVGFWTPLAKVGQYWLEGDGGGALKLSFSVVSGGTGYGSGASSVTLQAGRLNYIAATSVSSLLTLYFNGAQVTQGPGPSGALDTTANALLIGNRAGFSRFFAGQIADVRIWNGALTSSDISRHYVDPTSVGATSATLAARWKCNEGTGTTLTDSVAAHNATLSSASWNVPQLATGASHTVDDVIAVLQKAGLVHQ